MSDAIITPDKKMSDLNPRKLFFLVVIISNLDGSIDFSSEVLDGFITLEEAVNFAKEQVEEDNCEAFIYECLPRRRVSRIQIIVDHI